MEVIEAIEKRRSIRKFKNREIDLSILEELVFLASLHVSAVNRQPLRFAIVSSCERKAVHTCFRWASAIPDYEILNEQKPAAYIMILSEVTTDSYLYFEAGAAATNIMLSSLHYGLSSCCLGTANQNRLREILHIPDNFEVICTVALGYPDQESEIVSYQGNSAYFQNDNGKIYVPKRDYHDLIIFSDSSIKE